MTLVGQLVPNFTAETQLGQLDFHEHIKDSWTVLITFPNGFDPVASTELGKAMNLKEEFSERNCKIVGVVISAVMPLHNWIQDVSITEEADVDFPIYADESGEITRLFGLVEPEEQTLQHVLPYSGVFLIDDQRTVKAQTLYPISTGHNFYEALRTIDSLQLTRYNQIGTPANWANTEDVFINTGLSANDCDELFEKGYHEILPWFRITPRPALPEGMERSD